MLLIGVGNLTQSTPAIRQVEVGESKWKVGGNLPHKQFQS